MYITYVPTTGADAVTKKLGEGDFEVTGTLTAGFYWDTGVANGRYSASSNFTIVCKDGIPTITNGSVYGTRGSTCNDGAYINNLRLNFK